MGLFTRARAEDRTLTPQNLPGIMLPDLVGPTTTIDQRTWTQVSDVFACVRVLADAVSTLPLKVYRQTATGRQEVGPDARISQLLTQPWPGATVCDLLGHMMQSLAVDGNTFVGKFRDSSGAIVQLGIFDPALVTIFLRGQILSYLASYSGGAVETGPDDILHVRGSVTLDHLRGISPITMCSMAMGLNASLQASAQNLMVQGSRPSGVLRVKGGQSEFTVNKIAEQWTEKHSGAQNHHRVAVVSADEVDFVQLGLNASDAQFIQQRELSTREIARVFRVPAHMVDGDTGRSLTYANVSQQNRFFVEHSLRPWLVRIEKAISNDADLCPGGTFVEFDLDELLRGEPLERSQYLTAALNPDTGWMSRDEARQSEGLGPEPQPVGMIESD